MNHISFKQVQTAVRLLGMAVLAGAFALHAPSPAYAATIGVTTTNDELNADGDCSLREAVRAANTNQAVDACPAGSATSTDTIKLKGLTYRLTLPGASEDNALTGDLDITGALTIKGAGVGATVISGGNQDRVFDIRTLGANVTISQLFITDGSTPGFEGGGAIRNVGKLKLDSTYLVDNATLGLGGAIQNTGTLTVLKSVLLDNRAVDGGAIWTSSGSLSVKLDSSTLHNNIASGFGGGVRNIGTLTVINSTIDFNHAGRHGGGIFNEGSVTMNNSTVTINEADSNGDGDGDGGGIHNVSTLTVRNTILTHNVDAGGEAPDCAGPLTSGGYNLIFNPAGCSIGGTTTGNLIGVFSPLGPLDNNGGPTSTRMPDPGSAVLDAGSPATPGSGGSACAAKDQRGVSRPRDGDGNGTARCDIGAVER